MGEASHRMQPVGGLYPGGMESDRGIAPVRGLMGGYGHPPLSDNAIARTRGKAKKAVPVDGDTAFNSKLCKHYFFNDSFTFLT